MFQLFKNHPFDVETFVEVSLVLTFAVPKQQLQYLTLNCMDLDTYDDKWAFLTVSIVQTKDSRPKGFPKIVGSDFFHVGYSLFVNLKSDSGKTLRGLYVLKSETDQKKMQVLGNILTSYNYTTTDISKIKQHGTTEFRSNKSGFRVVVEDSMHEPVALPEGSPFVNWAEAGNFAGPLPFTFTCNSNKNQIVILEAVKSDWQPSPVKILDQHFSYLEMLQLNEVKLANAFIIYNTPYCWKRGKVERLKQERNI